MQILIRETALFSEFYHLTPYQLVMWESSGGLWHGMARADLFICDDGQVVCCELNSDTPSGQAEAVLLNKLLLGMHGSGVADPNEKFEQRFVEMLRASYAKRGGSDAELKSVGIIYPTELTEDLGMITLLTKRLETSGIKVVSGSPYNLHRNAYGGIEVLGVSVDLVFRHYKTDWWGERLSVWRDSPAYPDPDPLDAPLGALLAAEMEGQVTIVNPFGSVVTQNKLSLAFFWEEHQRFSARARKWIRRYIPETYRLATLTPERLRGEKHLWVIKSDYGCEERKPSAGRLLLMKFGKRQLSLRSLGISLRSIFFTPQPTREA
ncbi:MAG: hypothetical protein WKF84_24315 [Pyrinomonadaceae bacterium]